MIKRGNPNWHKGMKPPAKRPAGVPNKVTTDIREAFKQLVEANLGNMSKWLAEVAEKDPKNALDLTIKLSERFVPTLQRIESTGKDGEPILPVDDLLRVLKKYANNPDQPKGD